MAIETTDLPFLLEEVRARPFTGDAFVAGGRLSFDKATLQAAAAHVGVRLSAMPDGELSTEGLFRALGFSSVHVLSGGDTLDRPEPPAHLTSRFAMVFDFGESQRTFRLPDAFAYLGRLVAPGGRLVHVAPSANNMDAAWYMVSPTLLHDHYRANGWALERLNLLRCDPYKGEVAILAYEPGLLYPISHGGLDDAIYRIVCVVRREPASTVGRIPQQSFYERAWEAGMPDAGPSNGGTFETLKHLVRKNRSIYRALYGLAMARKKRNFRAACLKPVARYSVASWTRAL
ncbi:MAG: hypothetical protein AB7M05_14615 [Alphaproteobacteria bacterium]